MKTYLIIGRNVDLASFPFAPHSRLVGIDRGAWLALAAKLPLSLAVGDFDSCTDEEKARIVASGVPLIALPPRKDDTDTKHALALFSAEAEAEFILVGGIAGERIEHAYANLELAMEDERVSLIDDRSWVFKIARRHVFRLPSPYAHVSFFPIGESALVTLRGFSYDVARRRLRRGDGLAISNAWREKEAEIIVHEGQVICFLTREERLPL